MSGNHGRIAPVLAQKHYDTPSAFTPENLLREARRHKRIATGSIPAICILDPDGKLLISVTSSGQIMSIRPPPYFILIERALRDEGTSYYYLAASDYSYADATLIAAFDSAFVPNQMGRIDGDFEKGEADGSKDALDLVAIAADRLRSLWS